MDRAHDDRVRLAGQVDVVVEAPLAAHEASILEPLDRLADTELPHEAVVTHFAVVWSSPGTTSLQCLRKKLQLPYNYGGRRIAKCRESNRKSLAEKLLSTFPVKNVHGRRRQAGR
jgi:hypothetical protein